MSWWSKLWTKIDEPQVPWRSVVKQTTMRYVLTNTDDYRVWTYVLSCGHEVELDYNPANGGPRQVRCQECKDLLGKKENT
jgi:hypothetical protein